MELKQVGEFGLIDLIKRKVFSKGKEVILGIGDDTAVLRLNKNNLQLLTTDTLVEKVHFNLRYFPLEAIGWKGMVANLSDITAMGGMPKGAVVTLGINHRFKVEEILSIFSGVSKAAKRFSCPIVGGDVVFSPRHLFVSIAIIGEVKKGFVIKRTGAKVGDLIAVTGDLGSCLAGLKYLKKNKKSHPSLTKKFLYPLPRLKESQLINRFLKPTAMIDISDGLVSELYHLIVENKLGADIYEENIPVSKIAFKIAKGNKKKALSYALYSGEEYELLFAFNRRKGAVFEKLKRKFRLALIGEVTNKKGELKLVRAGSRPVSLAYKGYVHF